MSTKRVLSDRPTTVRLPADILADIKAESDETGESESTIIRRDLRAGRRIRVLDNYEERVETTKTMQPSVSGETPTTEAAL